MDRGLRPTVTRLRLDRRVRGGGRLPATRSRRRRWPRPARRSSPWSWPRRTLRP